MSGGIILKILKLKNVRRGLQYFLLLDTGEELVINPDLVFEYQLFEGLQLDESVFNEIKNKERIIRVKQSSLNYVAYKQRTEKQVRLKLKEKSFDNKEIDIAIKFLYEFNYLDDKNYARVFSKEYVDRKKAGPKRLFSELLKRGIKKDLAEKIVQEVFEARNNYEIALEAAHKKYKAVQFKTKEKQVESVVNYLMRQGFAYETIKKVKEKIF